MEHARVELALTLALGMLWMFRRRGWLGGTGDGQTGDGAGEVGGS